MQKCKNKPTLCPELLGFMDAGGTPPPVAKRDRLSSVRHASRYEASARTAPASFSREKEREKRHAEGAEVRKQSHCGTPIDPGTTKRSQII
jgi:hypothetical protein